MTRFFNQMQIKYLEAFNKNENFLIVLSTAHLLVCSTKLFQLFFFYRSFNYQQYRRHRFYIPLSFYYHRNIEKSFKNLIINNSNFSNRKSSEILHVIFIELRGLRPKNSWWMDFLDRNLNKNSYGKW